MHLATDAVDEQRRVPRLAPGREPARLNLTPAEGFLLSRIDGQTSWTLLREISGLPPEQVDSCLERWLSEGVVVLPGEAPQRAPARPPGGAEPDPALDLSPELQRDILRFEASLDRPYCELLGVAPDADPREIKRAYFALSRRYHPDRYYRRNVGAFGRRLERIFKKLVEAYELLSDPATRAEVERSLAEMPPPKAAAAAAEAAPAAPAPASKQERRRQALQRLRRQFRLPPELLAERRLKAGQFYQSALLALRKERWTEAAASVRLAIAFDPWADEYKQGFAEIQARVHQLRAAELLERANASWDDSARSEALRLYEEALLYRPCDPEVNARAARVAAELGELERAREYAETACELAPEDAACHCARGAVLRRAGLREKAREAFETALRLDPGHEEARSELTALRRGGRRS